MIVEDAAQTTLTTSCNGVTASTYSTTHGTLALHHTVSIY